MQGNLNQSIAQCFAAMAETCPHRPALVFTDITYDCRMLQDLVQAFTLRMADHGIDADSTVQLDSRDLPVVLASLLATSSLGAGLAEGTVTREIAGRYPVTHRLCVTSPAHDLQNERMVLVNATWSPAGIIDTPHVAVAPSIHSPWLMVATSGTTGIPKVVGPSQAMVKDRSMAVADEFLPGETRFVSLFPYGSRPFFARALGTLLNGATLIDIEDWAFWTTGGVNRVSGSLRQVKALTTPQDSGQKIAVVEVSGTKLTDQDAREMLAHFDLFEDTYGETETSKSFSNQLKLDPDAKLRRFGVPRDSSVEIITESGPTTQLMRVGTVNTIPRKVDASPDREQCALLIREAISNLE